MWTEEKGKWLRTTMPTKHKYFKIVLCVGRYADGRITPNHGFTKNFNTATNSPLLVRHRGPIRIPLICYWTNQNTAYICYWTNQNTTYILLDQSEYLIHFLMD